MAADQPTDFVAESESPKILGADGLVPDPTDISSIPSLEFHADILGDIHRRDLADVVEQRGQDQFVIRAYVE